MFEECTGCHVPAQLSFCLQWVAHQPKWPHLRVLYSTVQHFTVLYCTVLYCTLELGGLTLAPFSESPFQRAGVGGDEHVGFDYSPHTCAFSA